MAIYLTQLNKWTLKILHNAKILQHLRNLIEQCLLIENEELYILQEIKLYLHCQKQSFRKVKQKAFLMGEGDEVIMDCLHFCNISSIHRIQKNPLSTSLCESYLTDHSVKAKNFKLASSKTKLNKTSNGSHCINLKALENSQVTKESNNFTERFNPKSKHQKNKIQISTYLIKNEGCFNARSQYSSSGSLRSSMERINIPSLFKHPSLAECQSLLSESMTEIQKKDFSCFSTAPNSQKKKNGSFTSKNSYEINWPQTMSPLYQQEEYSKISTIMARKGHSYTQKHQKQLDFKKIKSINDKLKFKSTS